MKIFEDSLGSVDDVVYDIAADYYIYILKLKRRDNEIFYYVGKAKDVEGRINSHKRNNLAGSHPIPYKTSEFDCKLSDAEFMLPVEHNNEAHSFVNVKAYKIYDYYLDNIDKPQWYIRNQERKKMLELAIEKQTINILGGR